jgi:cell wall-associated NlpC family hydrolase
VLRTETCSLLVLLTAACAAPLPPSPHTADAGRAPGELVVAAEPYARPWTTQRVAEPARTLVFDAEGAWVATYTEGARTVALAGQERTFHEDIATDVVTSVQVRLLAAPFDGDVDEAWLEARLADTSPDVLAVAMQYVAGAPPVVVDGLQIAGDAAYGQSVGADFNDYLGVAWSYGDVQDPPEAYEFRALDCSGYVRMIFGYRFGLPLAREPVGDGAIPRRAWMQLAAAPGIVTIPDTGVQVVEVERLQPGDLVFFDASDNSGEPIDHVGIYLGEDVSGRLRFLSSRTSLGGPTFGDGVSPSLLDGDALFARSFRGARRL